MYERFLIFFITKYIFYEHPTGVTVSWYLRDFPKPPLVFKSGRDVHAIYVNRVEIRVSNLVNSGE